MARMEQDFEELSSFSSRADYNKKAKLIRGKHRWLKIILCVLCSLAIICGGILIYLGSFVLGGLTTNKITKDEAALGIVSGVFQEPKVTNIALFGLDSRGDNFEGLSDVIMVLSLDGVHNKVKLTSILRDSRVYMGDGGPASGYDKITHAYSYGGPELSIWVLNQNFGLNIKDYVTVNFSKMAQIVDAFGGVDLEVSEGEITHINKNLEEIVRKNIGATDADYLRDAQPGMLHLNGAQAVAYSRIRKLDSDNARAGRQQKIMEKLIDKAKGMSAAEYPDMIRKVTANNMVETSMNIGDIMNLTSFALTDFTVEHLLIPGEQENAEGSARDGELWMWRYDLEAAKEHVQQFILEDAYVAPTPEPSSSEDGYDDTYYE